MAHGRKVSRIKLEPPNPEDEKKYLLTWGAKELYQNPGKFPQINCQNLFGSPGSLQIEIGCGTGDYICGLALEESIDKFIGIDFSKRAIYSAVNLAARRKLDNIRFIRADFRQLYPLFRPNSLSMIYLHFPDPNYKAKHMKLRIFDKKFLDHMVIALIPNGKISVVTDEEPFFEDMLSLVEGDIRFAKTHQERYLNTFTPIAKSRFHLAWERINLPIFRFEIKKK